jgi:transcriptional regulator with XRE-family HTH domain
MSGEQLARDIMTARDDWRASMRHLGTHLRALRKLAGLSQQRLAQVAGVSQAAMSRIEAGRPTGQLAIFRIGRALNALLLPDCETLLSDEARRVLDALDTLAPAMAVATTPSARDRRCEEVLRLYQRASELDQGVVLAVLRALVR